jgi:hypothetical protein
MGTYNKTHAVLVCPRCGGYATMEAELFFGNTSNMEFVPIGREYPFHLALAVHNGGVPPDRNLDGEGYVECPLCCKDFFVKAIVRNTILKAIEVDPSIAPHIP